MAVSEQKSYYVGGRCYSLETSTKLCSYTSIFERVTLYKSQKGTFFTVRESTVDEIKIDSAAVEVLNKTAAGAFMDEHAAGIVIENYNRVFGIPKNG